MARPFFSRYFDVAAARVPGYRLQYRHGCRSPMEPPPSSCPSPAPAFFDRIELFVRDGDLLDEVIPFGAFQSAAYTIAEGVDALIVMASPADELRSRAPSVFASMIGHPDPLGSGHADTGWMR